MTASLRPWSTTSPTKPPYPPPHPSGVLRVDPDSGQTALPTRRSEGAIRVPLGCQLGCHARGGLGLTNHPRLFSRPIPTTGPRCPRRTRPRASRRPRRTREAKIRGRRPGALAAPPPSPPCARRGQNVPSKNAMHLRKQLKVGPKDKSVKVAPYHSSLWLGCKVGRKRDLTCTAWLVNLDRHKVRYVCPTHLKPTGRTCTNRRKKLARKLGFLYRYTA